MKYSELVRKLGRLDVEFFRQAKGSHEVWWRPATGRRATIPNHPNREIKRKTLASILKETLASRRRISTVPDPIPPGELEGLQAFALRVGAHAGQRHPDRPQWVEIDGTRVDVAMVDSEWREEERLGFRVTLRDGRRLLLYYVPNEGLWSGVIQV